MAEARYNEESADFRFRGDYVLIDGTLTVVGAASFTGGITVGSASGTTAGAAWTSGAPALTAGQRYITITAGSTVYRIPVWANS